MTRNTRLIEKIKDTSTKINILLLTIDNNLNHTDRLNLLHTKLQLLNAIKKIDNLLQSSRTKR